VKTTNIKYDFRLSFQNSKCLGHVCCLNDCYDEFVESSAHNESVWGANLIQLPIVDHYILGPLACTIGYKFCGVMFSNM